MQRYFRYQQISKKMYIIFIGMGYQYTILSILYIDREKELINQTNNKKKP